MLGIARAGHYTASWNTGELDWTPELTGAGNFSAVWPGITPSYSVNNSDRSITLNDSAEARAVDLTGWFASQDYNLSRNAFSFIIKLPEPNLLGGSTIDFGLQIDLPNLYNDNDYPGFSIRNDSNGTHYNFSGGYFTNSDLGYPGSDIELPHTLANHWIQIFWNTQETGAGVFANYSAGSSEPVQLRCAIYDLTANNTLLGVNDRNLALSDWRTNNQGFYDFSSLTEVKVSQFTYGEDDFISMRIFGQDGASFTSGGWFSLGKTFDPTDNTVVDETVLARSVASIGGVDAWINAIFTANSTPTAHPVYTWETYAPLGPNNLFTGTFGSFKLNDTNYWSNIDTPDGGGTF